MLQPGNVFTPADRARWLAELAAALDEARVLLRTLPEHRPDRRVPELELRIDAALEQVDALRRGRWTPDRDRTAPEWSMLVPEPPGPGRG